MPLSDFDFPHINNPDSANQLNQLKLFRSKFKTFYDEADSLITSLESRASALESATVTKSDVGLGNVSNYGDASQSDAETGTASDKFMTPQRTKQAVDKLSVPAGCVAYFAMSSAPSGWLKCNGATVSRATYAALFAAIGTTFGAGDGSTTFNIPDLRGEFVRGWSDGGSVDTGRVFGSAQAEAFKAHTHAEMGIGTGVAIATGPGYASSSISTGSAGGAETRPRNVALLACIKY